MTTPVRSPPETSAQQQARTDLFLLLGQGIAALVAGAWAARAAAPFLEGAAWMGSGLLLAALICGYGAVRVLVATVLAPWAVVQLMQRARNPQAGRQPLSTGERRFGLLTNAVAIAVCVAVALLGALALAWLTDGVRAWDVLWRFGLAAALLSVATPRALRALG